MVGGVYVTSATTSSCDTPALLALVGAAGGVARPANVFVTSDGHPHARFDRALRTGNPTLVRAAAAELGRVGLEDALRLCLVLATAERERYEAAAVRWLGRLVLEERRVTLADAQIAAAGLAALSGGATDLPALAGFVALCESKGLQRGARALDELTDVVPPALNGLSGPSRGMTRG
jgi:hypothetical protein